MFDLRVRSAKTLPPVCNTELHSTESALKLFWCDRFARQFKMLSHTAGTKSSLLVSHVSAFCRNENDLDYLCGNEWVRV